MTVLGPVAHQQTPTVSLNSALWKTKARDSLSDRTPIGEAQNDVWS